LISAITAKVQTEAKIPAKKPTAGFITPTTIVPVNIIPWIIVNNVAFAISILVVDSFNSELDFFITFAFKF